MFCARPVAGNKQPASRMARQAALRIGCSMLVLFISDQLKKEERSVTTFTASPACCMLDDTAALACTFLIYTGTVIAPVFWQQLQNWLLHVMSAMIDGATPSLRSRASVNASILPVLS